MMLRKIFLLIAPAVISLVVTGCGDTPSAALDIGVGIPPLAGLAGRIAGPDCRILSALPVGRSPHDFTPKPSDIRTLSGGRLFLYSGMPFEKNIVKALSGSRVRTVDVAAGVKRIAMTLDCHGEHDGHAHADSHINGDAADPHVWTSPENCLIISRNIAKAMSEAMPEKKAVFAANLQKLEAELRDIIAERDKLLLPYRGRGFFVHHPAFGYYARDAKLRQFAVELGGRDIAPSRLSAFIKEAKEQRAKTIFIQMQFNPAAARALTKAIGGNVVELDPLAADVTGSLRAVTGHLVEGFKQK